MLIKSKFMKSAIVALAAGMVGSVVAPVADAAVGSNSYTVQPNSAYSNSSNRVGQTEKICLRQQMTVIKSSLPTVM